jgi:hypothetical protein
VLDEDDVPLVTYHDKDMGCELVIIARIALLKQISEEMVEWINSQ